MISVPVASLPLVARHDIMDLDPPAGDTVALRIDLNGDGVKELIVNDGTGGSGGPGYHIYQLVRGQWKTIAVFQGGITLAQKANGYFQLIVRGRAGGGITGRDLYRFVDGRYRAVHGEVYQDGAYVRKLSPKELESLDEQNLQR